MASEQTPSLADLRVQAQKLTTVTARSGPVLHRGFEQIYQDSHKLVAKAGGADPQSVAAQARYFLATRGHDTDRQVAQIEQLDLSKTFEPVEPLLNTDVEGYLRHEHELIILTAIEEGRQETLKAFDRSVAVAMEADWTIAKRKLFEELGYSSQVLSSDAMMTDDKPMGLSAVPMTLPSAGDDTIAPLPLHMHSRMMNYATVVEQLNLARVEKNTVFSFTATAKQVAIKLDAEARGSAMGECWDLVAHVLKETEAAIKAKSGSLSSSAPSVHALYESQSAEILVVLTNASRSYLERQFMQFVEKRIAQSPQEAQLGGSPDTQSKIRAYAKLWLNRLGLKEKAQVELYAEQPVWAIIYFLIRAGQINVALAMVERSFAAYFESHEQFFPAVLKAYIESPDRTLSSSDRNKLQQQYARRGNQDAFKTAVFKILGRCDLSVKSLPDVATTTEDYVWLQLMLIRERSSVWTDDISSSSSSFSSPVASLPSSDKYNLKDLQDLLVKFGPGHFNPKGTNPIKYLQVLLLSAQFERAVRYLYSYDGNQPDAIHVGIALLHAGLLHVPIAPSTSTQSDFLLTDTGARSEVVRLDIARLVHRYARSFASSNPDKALHYFLTLGAESLIDKVRLSLQQVSQAFVRELVLDTRQFAPLIGDVLPDGSIRPGSLQKFAPLLGLADPAAFRKTIVEETAFGAESNGRLEDALQLYNLSQNYDKVLDVLNRKLGQTLLQSNEQDKVNARSVLEYYRQRNILSGISTEKVQTTQLLLLIMDAFSEARDGRHANTIKILEKTGLLPIGDSVTVEQKLDGFEQLHDAIKHHFADVLLVSETSVYKLYYATSTSTTASANEPARQLELRKLREMSRQIVKFTGMLKMRLPQETYAKIMQMDVFMN